MISGDLARGLSMPTGASFSREGSGTGVLGTFSMCAASSFSSRLRSMFAILFSRPFRKARRCASVNTLFGFSDMFFYCYRQSTPDGSTHRKTKQACRVRAYEDSF